MSILGLVILLVIAGVALHALNAAAPMDPRVKTIVNAVVIIALILWVAEALGLFHGPAFHIR